MATFGTEAPGELVAARAELVRREDGPVSKRTRRRTSRSAGVLDDVVIE